jgi:hypothetical protein
MDMPMHNEIERSTNHIHEEIFDNNDSDYEAIGEDIGLHRPSYAYGGMIFDRLQEPPRGIMMMDQ